MTDSERTATLEKAVRYLASRILGEGPQSDPVVLAAAADADPQSKLDPRAVLDGFASIATALQKFEDQRIADAAERASLMATIDALSQSVAEVARHQMIETAALVAGRAAIHKPSEELLAAAAVKAGQSPDEFTEAVRAAYHTQVAAIMESAA